MMAQPTLHETTGISITIGSPLLATSIALPPLTVTAKIGSYDHELKAMGGYWAANFTLAANQNELEGWLQDGLGRHVAVHNAALEIVWEGFVNQVELSLADVTATRGPLLDATTRAYVTYTPLDTSVSPPVRGATTTLGPYNDATAQARYGIIARTLSSGETTAAEAAQDAQTWLDENKEPRTISPLGQGGGQQVAVSCLGYVHWLEAYPYINTGVTGTVTVSTKVADILDADPNGLFASTNADIATNALLTRDQDNEQSTGWNKLKGLVALGDNTNARYLFGVYANRRAVYAAAPTGTTAYHRRLADPAERITTPSGGEVLPWDVRAGRWLFYPDFLIGRTQPTDRRQDPRYLFIEGVRFTAPYDVQLEGGRLDTIPQKLARAGLAGVGV